jgi:hypothetical protein
VTTERASNAHDLGFSAKNDEINSEITQILECSKWPILDTQAFAQNRKAERFQFGIIEKEFLRKIHQSSELFYDAESLKHCSENFNYRFVSELRSFTRMLDNQNEEVNKSRK